MFGMDPLSRPVAIAEILILLAFAAFVGWLLGRLVLSSRISTLRASVAGKEAELDECRRSRTSPSLPRTAVKKSDASAEAYSEPIADVPQTYVSADPLLPAYSHDDTPELTDALPLAASQFIPEQSGIDSYSRTDEPAGTPEPTSGVDVPGMDVPGMDVPGVDTSKVTNSEAAVLDRIAARAGEINFDRIGRATAAEADDLKDIIGIGPFLERKLHSLGIYTFRQVANFTKEDVDKVNSIIEFFPGRIERDNWVEQSQAFYERKYGPRS